MTTTDPRLTGRTLNLPIYRRACELWKGNQTVSRALVFLGAKLADANHFCNRLARQTDEINSSNQPVGPGRWRTVSREADAFIFAVYGALDAYTQVAARVAGVATDREIKFPQLSRLLAEESRTPVRWVALREWMERTYRARWFVALRRMRNEVNYRSVLPYPLKQPLRMRGPLDWPATYKNVIHCVETGLGYLVNVKQSL